MRLFSKEHDYYDGVGGFDSDPKRVFNRPSPYIEDIKIDFSGGGKIIQGLGRENFYLEFALIGFCGEIYPYIIYFDHGDYEKDIFFYDFDSFNSYFLKNEKKYIKLFGGTRGIKYKPKYDIMKQCENWFNGIRVSYFDEVNFFPYFNPIFHEQKVPYFQYRIKLNGGVLYMYPSLKDVQFYKVFDAYTCYQKIDMFLFNELVPPDKIEVEMTDELNAQRHGFDKNSFRKCKS